MNEGGRDRPLFVRTNQTSKCPGGLNSTLPMCNFRLSVVNIQITSSNVQNPSKGKKELDQRFGQRVYLLGETDKLFPWLNAECKPRAETTD